MSSHPCDHGLLVSARTRVLDVLEAADVEVRHRDLYAEGFEPALTAEEHADHEAPGVSEELRGHADDLRWCDTLVLVYPTWWSGQPAMLKGWVDRVWAEGIAWELPVRADRIRPLLRNVMRIVVVTTHGSSKITNAAQGEGGKRMAFRSLRAMCHPLARCEWWAFYGTDTSDHDTRAGWLDQLEERARRRFGPPSTAS